MVGMLSLLAVAPFACGGDKSPSPPAGGSGGSMSTGGGGSSGSGGITGTGPGTGGGPGRSDAGTSPTDVMLPPIMESGMATAKFCNPLSTQSGEVEFTLEVGTKKTLIAAKSGQCTPIKGMPCTPISAGTIPVRVLFEGEALLEGVWGPITPNTEVLFIMSLDAQNLPDLDGGTLKADIKCNTLDLETLLGGADGGAGGMMDGGTRPPRTPKIVVDWSRFATLDRVGLKPTARRARLGELLADRP